MFQLSFKRQIIIALVAGFFSLTTILVTFSLAHERAHLYHNSTQRTTDLAQSLAVSSLSWTLANDIVGLQEVVYSFRHIPELRYAMIISPSGQVEAYSDASKVGQYLTDEFSRTLLAGVPEVRIIRDIESMVDVAVPIMLEKRHVGWARIGVGREQIARDIHAMIWQSIGLVLLATAASLLVALLLASRLGRQITSLVHVAQKVGAGNREVRASADGPTDIAALGKSLNGMLDTLCQNEARLQQSAEEIQDLYDNAPCGYHSLDEDGTFLGVNATELAWLGYTREELIGKKRITDLFTEKSQQTFHVNYPRFKHTGYVHDLEFEMIRKDGTILPVLLNATAIYDADGQFLKSRSTLFDITERKNAEEARRIALEKYRVLFESFHIGVSITDKEGNLIESNPASERLLGISAYNLTPYATNAPRWPIIQPDGQPMPPDEFASVRALKEGRLIENVEMGIVKEHGQVTWINVSAAPIPLEGYGVAIAYFDITERKHMDEELARYRQRLEELVRQRTADLEVKNEELGLEIAERKLAEERLNDSYKELQKLATHLEVVREEEQKRIARELHDEMGGVLAALNINVALLATEVPAEMEHLHEGMEALAKLVDTGVQTMRHTVAKLRPSMLDYVGLKFAIERYTQDFQKNTGIECELRLSEDEPKLDANRSAAVFRIIQESLTNVAKHAQATKVNIVLSYWDNSVVLTIKDNGKGFDINTVKPNSFGLLGIRERAYLLGGKAEISSTPGKGTTVRISLSRAS